MRAAAGMAGMLAAVCAFAGTAEAQSCITRLPVNVSLPSSFAAAYKTTVPVTVTTTTGRTIRNLRAAVYTFSGDQIASGHRVAPLVSSATVVMRLAFAPLQEGSYTLVVTGEPNSSSSCGPKKLIRVVRFRGCLTTLPLKFVNLPGGAAADYGGYLSVTLQSTGPLIRELEGAVYDVNGTLFGGGTLSALYGQTTLNMKLNQPLVPGDYTVVVAGLIQQPPSCGPKTAQMDLHLG